MADRSAVPVETVGMEAKAKLVYPPYTKSQNAGRPQILEMVLWVSTQRNPAVRGWLASGCSGVEKPPSGSTSGCGQRPATLKLGVEAVLQRGAAVVALENGENGPAEIGGIALERL